MSHKKSIEFIGGLADPIKRVALSNDELIRINVEMIDATPAKIKTLQGYKKLYEEIISSAQEEYLENEKTPPLTSNDAAGEADPETAADPGNGSRSRKRYSRKSYRCHNRFKSRVL